jgi:hypothetical protein
MALDTLLGFANEAGYYAKVIAPSAICAAIIGTIAYHDFFKKKTPDTVYESEVYRCFSRCGFHDAKDWKGEAYSLLKYELTQTPTFAAVFRYATGKDDGKGLVFERRRKKNHPT